MENHLMMEVLREFGLGTCLALMVFGLMFWLVKNIMKDHRTERENYQTIISNHLSANTQGMKKLCDEIGSYYKVQQETNRYIRDEHREILKSLTKLNGKS